MPNLEHNYNSNFLSQVIIRLDFRDFMASEKVFHTSVVEEIQKKFPKKGMPQVMKFENVNVILEPDSSTTQRKTQEGFQQEFINAQNNKVFLSNKYIVIEINNYDGFESTLKTIRPIIECLFNQTNAVAVRTGVRYINLYEEGEIQLTSTLFSKEIGALVTTRKAAKGSDMDCIRTMALKEYNNEELRMNFRFGMYNRDYPNPLKKYDFALDYDCFCEEALSEIEAVISYIVKAHSLIQRMFEQSITDKLRKVMDSE